MAVNSFLVHGPDGLVVVDGQLTISDATALRDRTTAIGSPVVALLVTHPHPDHYAGAATAVEDSVPIYATNAVATVIRRDDDEKDAIVGPMMEKEWPTRRRFPDRLLPSGATVRLAGLDFTVEDLGPGESYADSVWKLGDAWFTGDVLCPGTHAYLADGQYTRWIDSLATLSERTGPSVRLFPGHGAPTNRDALAGQQAYVRTFVDAVAATLDLDPAGRATTVMTRMSGLVNDERLRFLTELSIEPVAQQMAASSGQDVSA